MNETKRKLMYILCNLYWIKGRLKDDDDVQEILSRQILKLLEIVEND